MATIKHTRDATANDSDKIVLTCPNAKVIEILAVHVLYTSTATAGNRQIVLMIQDDTDTEVISLHSGTVQAASLARRYVFAQGVYRETSFAAASIHVPIPPESVLLPGWDLRLQDENGVDAAADDMTVNVIYREMRHNEIKDF